MLVPKKISSTKLIILTLVLIVILGAILYFLFSGLIFSNSKSASPKTNIKKSNTALPEISPDITVDFLSQQPYLNLRSPSELPVTATNQGRSNPFSPIPYGLIESQ